MPKKPPQIGPRNDFPVRRLIEKMILGNMIFVGGFFLLGLSLGLLEFLDDVLSGYVESPKEYIEDGYESCEGFVDSLVEHPEVAALMLVFGTFCGLVWYWIARHLETRRLKKRFGILTKSCTLVKPDVKSPQS